MVLCLKARESRSLPGLKNTAAIDAGWSSLVARQAHNLKVAGSNPAPATKRLYQLVINSFIFFHHTLEIKTLRFVLSSFFLRWHTGKEIKFYLAESVDQIFQQSKKFLKLLTRIF